MSTHPGKISIQEYTYSLPDNRIAAFPLECRDSSQLLIYKSGSVSLDVFKNISEYIPANSLMIFNKTKVVPARLIFQKPTGGVIEIFCLEPSADYPDVTKAMNQTGFVKWKCLVGGASKWKPGQVLRKEISYNLQPVILNAAYVQKLPGSFIIELSWSPVSLTFAEVLSVCGSIPLPPYIKREPKESDKERYQTIYADASGSVAAPTAGLHFTQQILSRMSTKKICSEFLTLHVGAGTFMPVKVDKMEQHEMHSEWIEVEYSSIENIINYKDQKIIAVGTTSLRTIETLYWLGLKIHCEDFIDAASPLELDQWDSYSAAHKNITKDVALRALLEWMNIHDQKTLIAKTKILIAPGYIFRIADGLITNFHQPNSTLLLLVAAFVGEDWRKIYQHALDNDFRFLSYGDGCLLWKND